MVAGTIGTGAPFVAEMPNWNAHTREDQTEATVPFETDEDGDFKESFDYASDGPEESVAISTFNDLASEWRHKRRFISSVAEMAMIPAYQQIIGMGRDAIPLILDELRRQPDHWFWALKAITRQDPVPPGSRGRIKEMAEAWLQWGQKEGFVGRATY